VFCEAVSRRWNARLGLWPQDAGKTLSARNVKGSYTAGFAQIIPELVAKVRGYCKTPKRAGTNRLIIYKTMCFPMACRVLGLRPLDNGVERFISNWTPYLNAMESSSSAAATHLPCTPVLLPARIHFGTGRVSRIGGAAQQALPEQSICHAYENCAPCLRVRIFLFASYTYPPATESTRVFSVRQGYQRGFS